MLDHISHLLTSDAFMPHGMCFLWRPDLLWLHAVSDGVIALAYYSIPFALLFFVRRRSDLAFPWMFMLFGAFILACGTTHIMGIWTLWHPDYYLDGAIKAFTAVVSIGTAILLWRIMPQALALPSAGQLHAVNQSLTHQVAERVKAEDEARRLNAELERRVRERTAELEAANDRLTTSLHEKEVLLREVHHRVKNNLQIVSSLLALKSRTLPAELEPHFDESIQRIRSMAKVHEQLQRPESIGAFSLNPFLDELCGEMKRTYRSSDSTSVCTVSGDEASISFEHASPVVLILHELMSNAYKHGSEGPIEVRITHRERGVDIAVTNRGESHAETRSGRSAGGFGLRLVENLSRGLGGRIERTSAGGSTTVLLHLPESVLAQPKPVPA